MSPARAGMRVRAVVIALRWCMQRARLSNPIVGTRVSLAVAAKPENVVARRPSAR